MSADVFTIRVGDRLPMLAYKFGFSLVGATAVTFSAKDNKGVLFIDRQPAQIADGTYTIDGEAMALTPADGVVFYPWAAGDTNTARTGKALFHITWSGGLQESLPSEGFEFFTISENF